LGCILLQGAYCRLR